MQQQISTLTDAKSELAIMGDENTEQRFTFTQIEEGQQSTANIRSDGVIEMEISGYSAAIGVHETSHGYDLFKNGNYNTGNYLDGEVKAYQRQWTLDSKSIYKTEFVQGQISPNVYKINDVIPNPKYNDITKSWVLNININGTRSALIKYAKKKLLIVKQMTIFDCLTNN